jgi:hypothetical protein
MNAKLRLREWTVMFEDPDILGKGGFQILKARFQNRLYERECAPTWHVAMLHRLPNEPEITPPERLQILKRGMVRWNRRRGKAKGAITAKSPRC